MRWDVQLWRSFCTTGQSAKIFMHTGHCAEFDCTYAMGQCAPISFDCILYLSTNTGYVSSCTCCVSIRSWMCIHVLMAYYLHTMWQSIHVVVYLWLWLNIIWLKQVKQYGQRIEVGFALWAIVQNLVLHYGLVCRIWFCACKLDSNSVIWQIVNWIQNGFNAWNRGASWSLLIKKN